MPSLSLSILSLPPTIATTAGGSSPGNSHGKRGGCIAAAEAESPRKKLQADMSAGPPATAAFFSRAHHATTTASGGRLPPPRPPPRPSPLRFCDPALSAAGDVLEPPSGSFDATASPGDSLQNIVDGLRPSGTLLLLPGTYPNCRLRIRQEVHIFGRGKATLEAASGGDCITLTAHAATLDQLSIRPSEDSGAGAGAGAGAAGAASASAAASAAASASAVGVRVASGHPRLQGLDVSHFPYACVAVEGEDSDPALVRCRIASAGCVGALFRARCRGTVERCRVEGCHLAGLEVATEADPMVLDTAVEACLGVGIMVSEGGRGMFTRTTVTGCHQVNKSSTWESSLFPAPPLPDSGPW